MVDFCTRNRQPLYVAFVPHDCSCLTDSLFFEAQIVRLLPGTSATAGDSIWAVLPEGCFAANPGLDNCTASRGGAFDRNESDSWSTERLAGGGLYELNTFEESKLGLTGNAYYGFEAVDLGLDLPTMQHQLIAGIAGNDFWLGSLGLSPLPLNFTAMVRSIMFQSAGLLRCRHGSHGNR